MWDLDQHFASSRPRTSRRASMGQSISGTKSLPATDGNKQQRRSSLGLQNNGSSQASACCSTPAKSTPRKQTRRASLGQMLGNAQRFFSKDDSSTCVTTESSCHDTASLISTEEEARALLKEVKQTIQRHEQRKTEMERNVESDLELAKARLASGNRLGAVLSMRRVHKNTTQLAYTAGARYQLGQIRDDLQEDLVTADVTQVRRATRDITEKLLKAEAPTPTDEFLLHQLESQMEEIGV